MNGDDCLPDFADADDPEFSPILTAWGDKCRNSPLVVLVDRLEVPGSMIPDSPEMKERVNQLSYRGRKGNTDRVPAIGDGLIETHMLPPTIASSIRSKLLWATICLR